MGAFFKLIALLIPYVFVCTTASMLTSTLLALGRLSANNEITAMKASGLGLYQIMAPTFGGNHRNRRSGCCEFAMLQKLVMLIKN